MNRRDTITRFSKNVNYGALSSATIWKICVIKVYQKYFFCKVRSISFKAFSNPTVASVPDIFCMFEIFLALFDKTQTMGSCSL